MVGSRFAVLVHVLHLVLLACCLLYRPLPLADDVSFHLKVNLVRPSSKSIFLFPPLLDVLIDPLLGRRLLLLVSLLLLPCECLHGGMDIDAGTFVLFEDSDLAFTDSATISGAPASPRAGPPRVSSLAACATCGAGANTDGDGGSSGRKAGIGATSFLWYFSLYHAWVAVTGLVSSRVFRFHLMFRTTMSASFGVANVMKAIPS